MKCIKFSHDYEKLPVNWEGTEAVLLSVSPTLDMAQFQRRFPQLIERDTKFRGEEGRYSFSFKEGILLIFFHLNSGTFFSTIRSYTDAKYDYYQDCLDEIFLLERTQGNGNIWRKARKKPVIVEFREVSGEEEDIKTLEGFLTAKRGKHYVIKGMKGELYPIEKRIFEQTYDVVSDQEAQTKEA